MKRSLMIILTQWNAMTAYSGGRAERRPAFSVLGALLAVLAMAFAGLTPAGASSHPVEVGRGIPGQGCLEDAPYMGTVLTKWQGLPGEVNVYRFDVPDNDTRQLTVTGLPGALHQVWARRWNNTAQDYVCTRVGNWASNGQPTNLFTPEIQSVVFDGADNNTGTIGGIEDGQYWYRVRSGDAYEFSARF